MTFNQRLAETISKKNSLLCVGLDPDLRRLPDHLRHEANAILLFCREIIAATKASAAAFKINFAFFEAEGSAGWEMLEQLAAELPADVVKIADAKRADIGNTSERYAHAILNRLDFDAVTVNPYLGKDSVEPFLQWPAKGAFVLCLTSNPGSVDFQQIKSQGEPLYKTVAKQVMAWNKNNNCGLVVGATHPSDLQNVRELTPGLPFLIPGVGAQGGGLETAVKLGTDTAGGGALINSSRGIIYKSSGTDFAEAAALQAQRLSRKINQVRQAKTFKSTPK